jgi:hypothetical protein
MLVAATGHCGGHGDRPQCSRWPGCEACGRRVWRRLGCGSAVGSSWECATYAAVGYPPTWCRPDRLRDCRGQRGGSVVTVRGNRPSPRQSEVRQGRSQVNAFKGFAVSNSGADRASTWSRARQRMHISATGVRSDMHIVRFKASTRFAERVSGATPVAGFLETTAPPDVLKVCVARRTSAGCGDRGRAGVHRRVVGAGRSGERVIPSPTSSSARTR